MQKRGFPAAGILALLILAVVVLTIVIKLIYHQIDEFERRERISALRLINLYSRK